MGIKNPFGSKSERKLARKQKREAKFQATANVNRATRGFEGFMDDANREKLMLNERLAQRGMTGSTHASEELGYQGRAHQRAIDTLGENVELAKMGKDISSYGYKVQKRVKPLQIINDSLDVIGTGFSMLGGAGAGPGAEAEGTEGLEEAFLDY